MPFQLHVVVCVTKFSASKLTANDELSCDRLDWIVRRARRYAAVRKDLEA